MSTTAYPATRRRWETRPCANPRCVETITTQHRAARYCSQACTQQAAYDRDPEPRRAREREKYAERTALAAALAGEERDRTEVRERVAGLWDTPLLDDADRTSLHEMAARLENAVRIVTYRTVRS